MKKKLIIFFLAVPLLIIIYFLTYNEQYNYLAIGDALAKGHTPFDTYSKSYIDYLYDYLKTNHKNAKLNKDYTSEDLRIKDLISLVTNTKEETNNLPWLIKEADIITISIGSEELFSKLRSNYIIENNSSNFEYIDNMFIDLQKLLIEIKKLNKKPIYIIGYYNPIIENEENKSYINNLFNYLDIKFKSLENNNVYYIEINKSFSEKTSYLPKLNNAFPSLEGYQYVANRIIEKIES